jgi:hypothetical protein
MKCVRQKLRKKSKHVLCSVSFFPTENHAVYEIKKMKKYGIARCVGLTTLPPSSADCLEILEPQPPETPRACPGL